LASIRTFIWPSCSRSSAAHLLDRVELGHLVDPLVGELGSQPLADVGDGDRKVTSSSGGSPKPAGSGPSNEKVVPFVTPTSTSSTPSRKSPDPTSYTRSAALASSTGPSSSTGREVEGDEVALLHRTVDLVETAELVPQTIDLLLELLVGHLGEPHLDGAVVDLRHFVERRPVVTRTSTLMPSGTSIRLSRSGETASSSPSPSSTSPTFPGRRSSMASERRRSLPTVGLDDRARRLAGAEAGDPHLAGEAAGGLGLGCLEFGLRNDERDELLERTGIGHGDGHVHSCAGRRMLPEKPGDDSRLRGGVTEGIRTPDIQDHNLAL
jgi:hypothetical protein